MSYGFVVCAAGAVVALYMAVCFVLHRALWKTGQIVERRFPNGMRAHVISGDGLNMAVYKELFVDDVYFQHGLKLPQPGPKGEAPLIIDVGGNVGFFSLSLCKRLPCYDIVAFEPVPILAEAAKRNVEPFNEPNRNRRVQVVNAGCGSAVTTVTFDVDLSATAGASSHTSETLSNAWKQGHKIHHWMSAVVYDLGTTGNLPVAYSRVVARWLLIPGLNILCMLFALLPVVLVWFFKQIVGPKMKFKVEAKIVRLADHLKSVCPANDNRPIAMLKIDVEGAEWEVLEGIDDAMWKRVQQCVVETHDVDGRLGRVQQLLKDKGFKHVCLGVEELKVHELACLATVFATRAPLPSPSK